MTDQAETEAVARKIREFAMELERDGYLRWTPEFGQPTEVS